MTKILPSTFHYFDKHYPVLDDRRISILILRHASIPFTILADMIVGIAHLFFLGIRGQLNETFFWEATHQQLFEYPFQQLIHFLFTSVGTAMHQDYAKGYELGQWAVLNFSFEAYRGRPVIYRHMISRYEAPQYFPNIGLNNEDRNNLYRLVEHTIRFRSQKALELDGPLYQLFYDKPPLSIQNLGEIYLQKVNQYSSCDEKSALQEAKSALEAFFALPLVLRVHLLRPMQK